MDHFWLFNPAFPVPDTIRYFLEISERGKKKAYFALALKKLSIAY